jgi:hypothetical protein
MGEGTSLTGDRLIKMILLMHSPIARLYFKALKFKKCRCKNIYLVLKNREKDTTDGVPLELV